MTEQWTSVGWGIPGQLPAVPFLYLNANGPQVVPGEKRRAVGLGDGKGLGSQKAGESCLCLVNWKTLLQPRPACSQTCRLLCTQPTFFGIK